MDTNRCRSVSRLGAFFVVAALVGLLAGCDNTPEMVSGQVTANPSGAGVGGVVVEVYSDDSETLIAETVSTVDGRWTVRESTLTDGTYRVRIGDRWWPDEDSWANAETVAVSSTSPAVLDSSFDEIGALSGGIVDDDGNDLPGIDVVATRSADGQLVAIARTDTSGRFTLPVIETGTYRLAIADPAGTWTPVLFGGPTPIDVELTTGTVAVGDIDISTGLPSTPLGTTTRVSIASDGTESDNPSTEPQISSDGRYIAFASYASNLVPDDTNESADVFVHDRTTGTTTRVSVASDGTQANDWTGTPSISDDGRFIGFQSLASNLVPDDTNGHVDVFLHDRMTGTTTRLSVAPDGAQAVGGDSYTHGFNPGRRYMTYYSAATNLVPGDTNQSQDVFVYDLTTGTTTRVSTASDGTQGNAGSGSSTISADGRYVTFLSWASNLVPDDTNGHVDVFLHDRTTGSTTRISVAHDGSEADEMPNRPVISADGRYVAYESRASNVVPDDTNAADDVFVYDRTTGTTTRVSIASDGTQADRAAIIPEISADGRFITFQSYATNLVPGDSNNSEDVFVHDRTTGTTTRISRAPDGSTANGHSSAGAVSPDGRYITFVSYASNLVPGDTNQTSDVFVHDRTPD